MLRHLNRQESGGMVKFSVTHQVAPKKSKK